MKKKPCLWNIDQARCPLSMKRLNGQTVAAPAVGKDIPDWISDLSITK